MSHTFPEAACMVNEANVVVYNKIRLIHPGCSPAQYSFSTSVISCTSVAYSRNLSVLRFRGRAWVRAVPPLPRRRAMCGGRMSLPARLLPAPRHLHQARRSVARARAQQITSPQIEKG